MSKNKELTHQKILSVAKEEFLKNGFPNTSIREIARKVGITSAALYRHAKSKEDLFCQIVEPFEAAFAASREKHISQKLSEIKNNATPDQIKTGSGINLDLLLTYRTEIKLILENSAGTRYENFLHEKIEEDCEGMTAALELLRQNGNKVQDITKNELHIFVSAFYTAVFEPILHDYSDEETVRCFNLAGEFFMPGWLKFMGY